MLNKKQLNPIDGIILSSIVLMASNHAYAGVDPLKKLKGTRCWEYNLVEDQNGEIAKVALPLPSSQINQFRLSFSKVTAPYRTVTGRSGGVVFYDQTPAAILSGTAMQMDKKTVVSLASSSYEDPAFARPYHAGGTLQLTLDSTLSGTFWIIKTNFDISHQQFSQVYFSGTVKPAACFGG